MRRLQYTPAWPLHWQGIGLIGNADVFTTLSAPVAPEVSEPPFCTWKTWGKFHRRFHTKHCTSQHGVLSPASALHSSAWIIKFTCRFRSRISVLHAVRSTLLPEHFVGFRPQSLTPRPVSAVPSFICPQRHLTLTFDYFCGKSTNNSPC